MTIRTLIVDDEFLARERLRSLLTEEPDVSVVGECDDGRQALVAIETLGPDLVFLDLNISLLDGLRVLEGVATRHIPAVVLTSTDARYALKAFEVQAADYMRKPFGHERLRMALDHVRERLTREGPGEASDLSPLIDDRLGSKQKEYAKRIMIKDGGRFLFVNCVDIDWIQAAGNYVRFHVGTHAYARRLKMSEVESRLDSDRFIRIHRSAIVNIDRIKEMRATRYGSHQVTLYNAVTLTMSPFYRRQLDELRGPAPGLRSHGSSSGAS